NRSTRKRQPPVDSRRPGSMARNPLVSTMLPGRRESTGGWRFRVLLFVVLVAAVATVWVTNRLLTDRFTEVTRNRAELRLALYGGNLVSELRRNSIVPQLLARDPTLIAALNSKDF